MPKRHGEYREYDVLRFNIRNKRWWALCSQVNVDELRKEIKAEEFASIRARGLTAKEREDLRKKVSVKQKQLYQRERKIKYVPFRYPSRTARQADGGN